MIWTKFLNDFHLNKSYQENTFHSNTKNVVFLEIRGKYFNLLILREENLKETLLNFILIQRMAFRATTGRIFSTGEMYATNFCSISSFWLYWENRNDDLKFLEFFTHVVLFSKKNQLIPYMDHMRKFICQQDTSWFFSMLNSSRMMKLQWSQRRTFFLSKYLFRSYWMW